MILIKTTNNQINKFDEWTKDETGWRSLDSMTVPIRSAGFRGTGEITVEQVKSRIEQKVKLGESEGYFKYLPRIEHDQTQNEFPFFVFWKNVEIEEKESPKDGSPLPSEPDSEN